jgi:hypothetical protein
VNGPEVVLVAVFVAVWVVPLALALVWERRYSALRARLEQRRGDSGS